MKVQKKKTVAKVLAVAAAAASMTITTAIPADASTNDNFSVGTYNTDCGQAGFVDYGLGAPGGGNNDDYVKIFDVCRDGHGVKAWAWIGSTLLGSAYDGAGVGSTVIWDPFPSGNVAPGDLVGLKVCLVDGSNDPTPFDCESASHRSVDG
jgi:hypothetical protein